MKPVRDSDGAILNAAVLRDSHVIHERVQCPGCGKKIFERWPDGWDAHAAHRCLGLESTTEAERKIEYKTVFRSLFRP